MNKNRILFDSKSLSIIPGASIRQLGIAEIKWEYLRSLLRSAVNLQHNAPCLGSGRFVEIVKSANAHVLMSRRERKSLSRIIRALQKGASFIYISRMSFRFQMSNALRTVRLFSP